MLCSMRQKRVLIVEDDADLRRMFRTSLALAGYDVDEAGDGVRRAAHRGEPPARSDRPRPVLHSLDGISVQQELAARAVTRQIPIVVVTGSAIATDALPVACVLRKPVMPDELVRTVRHCIVAERAGVRRLTSHCGNPVARKAAPARGVQCARF